MHVMPGEIKMWPSAVIYRYDVKRCVSTKSVVVRLCQSCK